MPRFRLFKSDFFKSYRSSFSNIQKYWFSSQKLAQKSVKITSDVLSNKSDLDTRGKQFRGEFDDLRKKETHLLDFGWDTPRKYPNKPPVMILVCDGGGLKGAMSTQIIRELETKLKDIDPSLELRDCFDFMMGTSTGGLIALGLGKFKWNGEQIDNFYDVLGKNVFITEKSWFNPTKWLQLCKTGLSVTGLTTQLDTSKLEKYYKQVCEENLGDANAGLINNEAEEPLVAVVTTLVNNYKMNSAMLLRNYDITSGKEFIFWGDNEMYFIPGTSSAKTWEAARATSAAPTYFKPISIKQGTQFCRHILFHKMEKYIIGRGTKNESHISLAAKKILFKSLADNFESQNAKNVIKETKNVKELENLPLLTKSNVSKIYKSKYELTMVDGGMNSNSPGLFAISEAISLWPGQDVCILSIGTGKSLYFDQYEHKASAIYIENLFESLMESQESADLLAFMTLADGHQFRLSRWNAVISDDKTNMAQYENIGYYRQRGKQYANKIDNDTDYWAQLLAKHAHNGWNETNKQTFLKTKQKYKDYEWDYLLQFNF